uniref:Gnk2-homologous domain-containing protein n=1 Tax=Chenopodium quinoa TaxID=63459 RepID=A0A803LKV6_CHEQI
MISKSTSRVNYVCSNTTMFDNNSKYQANLNTLFRFLSSNSTNPTGFHQAVSGNGENAKDTIEAVYGPFLCRGDQNISSCQDCVTTATTTDLPNLYCPNRKEAIIWYDECMVRYSNKSFFNTMDDSWAVIMWYNGNINTTGNATRFMELMYNMMNNVIAVRAADGGKQKKFATDLVKVSKFRTIYGLGQCTPDLSASDCNLCLVDAIGKFTVSQFGRVLQPSCYAEYDVHPFFDMSTLPAPPSSQPSEPPIPSPTDEFTHSSGKVSNTGKTATLITVSTFLFVIAVAV